MYVCIYIYIYIYIYISSSTVYVNDAKYRRSRYVTIKPVLFYANTNCKYSVSQFFLSFYSVMSELTSASG